MFAMNFFRQSQYLNVSVNFSDFIISGITIAESQYPFHPFIHDCLLFRHQAILILRTWIAWGLSRFIFWYLTFIVVVSLLSKLCK